MSLREVRVRGIKGPEDILKLSDRIYPNLTGKSGLRIRLLTKIRPKYKISITD